MNKTFLKLAGFVGVVAGALPSFASAQSITEFNNSLTSAVGTSTDMIASLGGKGVLITLAVLTVAVVIIFIRIGWRNGLKAMSGRG